MQVEEYVVLERLAASQKQSGKTQDKERNLTHSEERRVAEHPRQTWEIAELLGDKRRMAGFDFVDGSVFRTSIVCQ